MVSKRNSDAALQLATSDVRAQDDLYEQAASEYGAALALLARGYEADPDKRRDLLQEIHLPGNLGWTFSEGDGKL